MQIAGWRRMSPADKLRIVVSLIDTGIKLRMAGVRAQHPEWPDAKIEREARRALLYART